MTKTNSRLTDDEQTVLDLLSQAWDQFLKLPVQHPMHQSEMCSALHACQRIVMCRVVERQEGWTK